MKLSLSLSEEISIEIQFIIISLTNEFDGLFHFYNLHKYEYIYIMNTFA